MKQPWNRSDINRYAASILGLIIDPTFIMGNLETEKFNGRKLRY
jgi:hypothetical protein